MSLSSYFSLKAFYKQKRLLFLALLLITISISAIYLFVGQSFTILQYPKDKSVDQKLKPLKIDEILGDSISISQGSFDLSFSNLTDQIKVWIHEARPGDLKNKHYLEVAFHDKTSKIVSFEDKIFLKYLPEINSYEFSSEPTDVWFVPYFKEGVTIKLFAKYILDGKEIIKEEEIKLKALESEKMDFPNDEAFTSLKEAKWIGSDLFEEMYGEKKNLKQRLLANGYIFEVGKDDLLINKDGRWQIGAAMDGCALARLKSLTANSLEFDFWPKDGFQKRKIELNSAAPSSSITLADDFITDIHLRTQKQVSCRLEKQRIIMREKDLLLKKDGKWKIVRLPQLKKEKNLGEFLVFDSIEIQGNNKLFKGYLFNKDRTQVVKVQKEIVHRKDPLQRKRRR